MYETRSAPANLVGLPVLGRAELAAVPGPVLVPVPVLALADASTPTPIRHIAATRPVTAERTFTAFIGSSLLM